MTCQTREVLRSVANTIEALSREAHNTTVERQHLHTAAAALWCAIDCAHVQSQLAALPALIADARAKLDALPAQDDILEDPEVMRNADAQALRKYELD